MLKYSSQDLSGNSSPTSTRNNKPNVFKVKTALEQQILLKYTCKMNGNCNTVYLKT
jgi:hypothetical protein